MFERKAGITVRQYLSCASAVMTHTLQHSQDGPLFNRHTVAAATPVNQLFQAFFNLTSQSRTNSGAPSSVLPRLAPGRYVNVQL